MIEFFNGIITTYLAFAGSPSLQKAHFTFIIFNFFFE